MSITVSQFRNVLDESEVLHHLVNKRNFEFICTQTEPFHASFKFVFAISEENDQIQANGLLCEIDLTDEDFEKAYRFCNQWNQNTVMPKVYVQEAGKMLICEWTWDTECNPSDDFIKGLILGKFIQGAELCITEAIKNGVYVIPGYIPEEDDLLVGNKQSNLLESGDDCAEE